MHKYVNNFWRNEIVAALAEFAGTFMFLCKLLISLSRQQTYVKKRSSYAFNVS